LHRANRISQFFAAVATAQRIVSSKGYASTTKRQYAIDARVESHQAQDVIAILFAVAVLLLFFPSPSRRGDRGERSGGDGAAGIGRIRAGSRSLVDNLDFEKR
jgi:hypothetical protein